MGKLNGRFSEKSGGDEKTTGITTVDADKLVEFIKESLENQKIHTPSKRVIIGTVSDEAQKRIEEKCGSKVKNINIDNHSIVHAKNGYLLVCDVWRQKKARSRRSSDAAKKPPRTYAQGDSPHNELYTISHKSDEKSSGTT